MRGRIISLLALAALCASGCAPASWAADALLHPARRPVDRLPTIPFERVEFSGVRGVLLKGWRYSSAANRRGTIVVLHGIADNRASSIGIADRFTRRGFDVVAYDSRAHGESGGEACTYGYYEKGDLRAVLDRLSAPPIVVVGASLGAAVALQAAGNDHRIAAIVAAETFSDLETIARERAPAVLPRAAIERAFALAEARGRFRVDEVSPVAAAPRIKVPVLLIHGADDVHTRPDHSRRVFDALAGPKELMLVPGAGHNRSLSGSVWPRIERWLDSALSAAIIPP